MTQQFKHSPKSSDLYLHWFVLAVFMLLQIAYVLAAHYFGKQWQQHWPESQREVIRTVFYAIAIVTLPMTNLIRHVMVRLNQTMPGGWPASKRYLTTVIVSMVMVEAIGLLGFLVFVLGDDFNSLYIFTLMDFLGLFLYRPKFAEYLGIVEALSISDEH